MTGQHEFVPLCSRSLMHLMLDDQDAVVMIDHAYLPEGKAGTCCHDGCGRPAHDPGQVGIFIINGEGDEAEAASVMLSPEQALLVANRLTKAAELVLESEEDLPDVEREAARFKATG